MIRVLLVALLVFAMAACGSRSRYSHTRADVDQAFQAQGFQLVSTGIPGASGNGTGVVLRPRKSTSESFFFVVVAESDADAAEAFSPYEQMAGENTYDALSGNVLVIADDGVTSKVRARLDAVIADLAD